MSFIDKEIKMNCTVTIYMVLDALLYGSFSRDDIKDFIIELDRRVEDLDFSIDLIITLIKEVSPDCEISDFNKIRNAIKNIIKEGR
jgi:hypothetical protein